MQLYLNNLLRVPQIKKNLISVSRFAGDNDVFFEFYPDYCVVKDILTKKVLLQGNASKGLYKFVFVHSKNTDNVENCCNIS